MKTILNLKQYVILLVAAFAMTSCLDSDDPDFQVVGTGYVIQSVSEVPGEEETTTIRSKFTPVIYAGANEPMTKCSVKAPGGESILMTQIENFGGYYWLSNFSIIVAWINFLAAPFKLLPIIKRKSQHKE